MVVEYDGQVPSPRRRLAIIMAILILDAAALKSSIEEHPNHSLKFLNQDPSSTHASCTLDPSLHYQLKWVNTCEEKLKMNVPDFVKPLLAKCDFNKEIEWLQGKLEQENSPVVFCHNDMQEGNILKWCSSDNNDKENNNGEKDIVIIDFEYCSYNYRGFDIANHFIEWVYDYKESNHPFYKENWKNYPCETQRLNFVKAYLEERSSRENPKKVLKEVETFSLASHFFWSLWAFVNADMSQIPFGYWEYACSRLSSYFHLKEKLTCNMQIKRKVDCLSLD